MGNKKISIILPTYNGERYIKEAIDSCLNQSYRNMELIVIDDGSTQDIGSIVKSYSDDRIIFHVNDEKTGQACAINKGFSLANGKYLTWMSDDNVYDHGALEYMAKVLDKNRKVDFVYTNFFEIDEDGKVIRKVNVRSPKTLKYVNYIGLCFLFDRKIYDKIGGISPDAFLVEDYEYWLRIYYNGFKMKKIDKTLYYFRYQEQSLTCTYSPEEVEAQAQKARDKFIPEHLKLYQHAAVSWYRDKDKKGAEDMLRKSLALNPFNYEAARLLAVLSLDPIIVYWVRNMKKFIKP